VLAALVALALVPPIIGASTFLMRLAVLALVFALFAIATNISFGHTDQLFLFVGGLAGVGAYTTLLSADALGISGWITLPVGMAFCALIAGAVSYVSAKRSFSVIVISILTLNLQLALSEFFVGASDITGGSTGFFYDGLIPASLVETFRGLGFVEPVALYYVVLAFVGASLVVYVRLINSRYGMAFDAIREDEQAAASTGVDVVRYKTFAGALSGALIGLGGVLYAERGLNVISPGVYSFLSVDVLVLIMLVVGGLRTTLGPVVGAGLITVIEELLRRLNNAVGAAEIPVLSALEIETAVFGALLIVLFLYFRQGVMPAVERLLGGVSLPGRGGGGSAESEGEPGD
jgi:branched-chain amino acid transport system permease protein